MLDTSPYSTLLEICNQLRTWACGDCHAGQSARSSVRCLLARVDVDLSGGEATGEKLSSTDIVFHTCAVGWSIHYELALPLSVFPALFSSRLPLLARNRVLQYPRSGVGGRQKRRAEGGPEQRERARARAGGGTGSSGQRAREGHLFLSTTHTHTPTTYKRRATQRWSAPAHPVAAATTHAEVVALSACGVAGRGGQHRAASSSSQSSGPRRWPRQSQTGKGREERWCRRCSHTMSMQGGNRRSPLVA